MRFAYIDSNGNEVPIPSVDALALRIELGAITDDTQLYDAQADQWGPAHTHEIFHTLSRDAEEEEGFVAPPPVAPPPVAPPEPEAGRETSDEVAPVGEQPPPDEGEKADEEEFDSSFGLTLAEPEPPAEDETATEHRAPRRADELPLRKPKAPAAGEDDDLPYLELEPQTGTDDEDEGADLAASDAPDHRGGGFDYGDVSGGLELEEAFDGPETTPKDLESSGSDRDDPMGLETANEFDASGFEGSDDRPLDLEKPMSDFTPAEPPAWMEEDEPDPGDKVLDFSSAGADLETEGEVEVPLRERRTPRNKPSAPKLRRQYNVALPIVGIVVVLAVGIGGYVAWPIARDRLLGPAEGEVPAVSIPPLSEELVPQMRASAEAALAAVFDRELAEWAETSRVQRPPSAWLAGLYLANAGDYEEVEEFWNGVSDFVDRVRATDLDTFDAALRAELAARGIAGADAEAIRARADSGFVAAAPRRAQVIEGFDALIDAALQLHRFLIVNESAIEYAPASVVTTDPVLEVNPATEEIRAALDRLLDSVTDSLSALGYRDPVTAEGLRALLRARILEQGVD